MVVAGGKLICGSRPKICGGAKTVLISLATGNCRPSFFMSRAKVAPVRTAACQRRKMLAGCLDEAAQPKLRFLQA